jgi:hypothetical protein
VTSAMGDETQTAMTAAVAYGGWSVSLSQWKLWAQIRACKGEGCACEGEKDDGMERVSSAQIVPELPK